MSKGKPRWYPEKRANTIGPYCSNCDEIGGVLHCESGVPQHIVESVCKGNSHNCCKVTYRKWAGKLNSDGRPHVTNRFDTCNEE